MLDIRLICVGKIKENHWNAAQEEFLRRLKPFVRLDIKEVKAEPLGDTVTAGQVMDTEGERILRMTRPDDMILTLDSRGEKMDSESFARLVNEAGGAGRRLTFIIGGAAGLSPGVLGLADKKISLSEMTFTHEMARIFLLEQLYRSATIIAGKKYHY